MVAAAHLLAWWQLLVVVLLAVRPSLRHLPLIPVGMTCARVRLRSRALASAAITRALVLDRAHSKFATTTTTGVAAAARARARAVKHLKVAAAMSVVVASNLARALILRQRLLAVLLGRVEMKVP